jgi:hypothetical protein
MTDLVLPDRSNPRECLEWALRTLDAFSRKERRGVLAVKEIQGIARNLLAAALKADPSLHDHPMLRKNGQLYHRRAAEEKRYREKLHPSP